VKAEEDFPWWLIILAVTGIWAGFEVWSDPAYAEIVAGLAKGVVVTIGVTLTAFLLACVLGLGLAVAVLSKQAWLRQAARLWIEVIRGVPIMVLLLYVAFVVAPGLVWAWNGVTGLLGLEPIRSRDFPLIARAVLALTLAYSAFLAEIFRAGLQSVEKGQVEAAMSLGLSGWFRFRLVVFPQAFRVILPPLGNDFVAMVKDSSLVSILGVADITQIGKVMAAGNFRYFETYNMVALLYLVMTVSLSLALRRFERGMKVVET
jgi:His/Glu/Gln/Arg/opine family amino acid ABC transporter permease subunit